MPGNLLIAMSGGTTCVINATLAGIIRTAQQSGAVERIFVGCPGIQGALKESMLDLTEMSSDELELLAYTPSSGFAGTARIKPLEEAELERLGAVLDAHQIRYFINIGGNGTIKQSMAISSYLGGMVQIASAAKTVDNDLGDAEFEEVLYTPGFPSCAHYWRHKTMILDQENLGACEHDAVLIAQTFGRKTGFLAGCARLADPERRMPLLLLLPEDQRPLEEVLGAIERMLIRHGRAVVVMSEGYDAGDLGERYDRSGQVMYGSSRTTAAQNLVNHLADRGVQARTFIPTIDQRSESLFVSELDLMRSYEVGRLTLQSLLDGERNFLGSMARSPLGRDQAEFRCIPFSRIQDYSRRMPSKWIAAGEFDVTDDYLEYVLPLIGRTWIDLPQEEGQMVFLARPNRYAPKRLTGCGSQQPQTVLTERMDG